MIGCEIRVAPHFAELFETVTARLTGIEVYLRIVARTACYIINALAAVSLRINPGFYNLNLLYQPARRKA